jgi:Uma2 family endonuclease
METDVARKKFSVDEYHRMGEAGIFHPEMRLELIEGEVLEMSPVGTRHVATVNRATALFVGRLAGRAMVSVQNPVTLDGYSEPQPDLLLAGFREDYYASRRIGPPDVLLAIEVSDTTLRHDRDRKMPLYARAGVRELWIVDLGGERLHAYRDVGPAGYRTVFSWSRSEDVTPAAFPDVVIRVEELIG